MGLFTRLCLGQFRVKHLTARKALKRKLTCRRAVGALKGVKKLEEGGRTTHLAALCREPRAICMFLSFTISINPILIIWGCSLSPSHRCSHTNLYFPGLRMKTLSFPKEFLVTIR